MSDKWIIGISIGYVLIAAWSLFHTWRAWKISERWKKMAEEWKGIAEQGRTFSSEQSVAYRKIVGDLVSAHMKLQGYYEAVNQLGGFLRKRQPPSEDSLRELAKLHRAEMNALQAYFNDPSKWREAVEAYKAEVVSA